jgi:hypothetical protein
VRFAVAARPVLVGFVPGVTAAVSSTDAPALTVEGAAPPVTVGDVGVGGGGGGGGGGVPQSGPGQIQQATPLCDEQVPVLFCEQEYVPSLHRAVGRPHGAELGVEPVQFGGVDCARSGGSSYVTAEATRTSVRMALR